MEHDVSSSADHGRSCRCQACRGRRAAYQRDWRLRNPDSGKIRRQCERCGADFMAWPDNHSPQRKRVSIYCSRPCARNAPGTGKRVALFRPGHPLAGVDGRVLVYRYRLYEKIGPGEHPCHWCKATVTWNVRSKAVAHQTGDLVVDHLDSNQHNNEIENLAPACQRCNGLRGAIRVWEERTGLPISTLIANSVRTEASR